MSAPLRGSPPPVEQLADYVPRARAAIIDLLAVAAIALAAACVLYVLFLIAGDSSAAARDRLWANGVLIAIPILGLYAPLLMARAGECNGQTWGKQLVGVRVIRNRIAPMDVWWGLLRDGVGKPLLVPLTLLLDCVWPLWDRERQAVHDKVADTWVVWASIEAPDAPAAESASRRAERGG